MAFAILLALGLVFLLRFRGRPGGGARRTPVQSASSPAPRGADGASRTEARAPATSVAPPPSASAPSPEPPELDAGPEPTTLAEQKQALLLRMQRALRLDDAILAKIRALFDGSKLLGQGNPEITKHPMTRAECRARRSAAAPLPEGDPRCGAPNMVPLYDPSAGQRAGDAKVCIDQYEFPNVACEYPVVWVRADEAVDLCRAMGKRICDAHEWEGACAGALKPPEVEYPFGKDRLNMEYFHNKDREIVWAYGKEKDQLKCATGSRKSPKCLVPDWRLCGSNTYPAGAFPDCRSSFGVFDLHGNAAEHMNFPLKPEELASRGGLGETEMKGSWFIFAMGEAHLDDCRWRAPMWHRTRIDSKNSHYNYHLGFRCCRDI